jgi:hypothetical protein
MKKIKRFNNTWGKTLVFLYGSLSSHNNKKENIVKNDLIYNTKADSKLS